MGEMSLCEVFGEKTIAIKFESLYGSCSIVARYTHVGIQPG